MADDFLSGLELPNDNNTVNDVSTVNLDSVNDTKDIVDTSLSGYGDVYKPQEAGYNLFEKPSDLQPSRNSMVQDRLVDLLERDNPYIKSARDRAMEMASQRGLLNSSIAAGAAERAAIEAALPIAQQDASTWQKAELTGYEAGLTDWLNKGADARQLLRDTAQQQYTLQNKGVDLANQLSLLRAGHGYSEAEAQAAYRRALDSFLQQARIDTAKQKDIYGYQRQLDTEAQKDIYGYQRQLDTEAQKDIYGYQRQLDTEAQKDILTFQDAIEAAGQERGWDYDSKGWLQDTIMKLETDPNIKAEDKTTLIRRAINLADYMSSFDFSGVEIV